MFSSSNDPIRAVIVGAGSTRQGTGPWIARHLDRAGCQLVGVVGRDLASADRAARSLKERFGIETSALESLEQLDRAPSLVVIASPAHTHRQYIQQCLDLSLPMICEKPFVWDASRNNMTDSRDLADTLLQSGTPLWLMTQWSESLEAFRLIYPDVDLDNLTSFDWQMAPSSRGADMLIDALPHAFDMLLTLCPSGDLEESSVTWENPSSCQVKGRWTAPGIRIDVTISLISTARQPRPFSYALNGCRVDRQIDMTDYSPSFRAQGGIFPINDPMTSRILKILPHFGHDGDNGRVQPTAPATLLRHTELLDQIMKVST